MRREQTELARQQQVEQVNFMDRAPYENASGSDDEEDFQPGRR